MKKLLLAALLGLGLVGGVATVGTPTPAMAQGKIYYGPGGPGYGSAYRPYRPGYRGRYVAPRPYGYRRGYSGPRRGYHGPRHYYRR
ncbi:hypothetical protein [Enterovirga aerilata]|uniref:Sulfur globule protein n=1 Tax=Enterovirga aerilata TaxID=2730920 RepID=A0A849IF37_9HYPH|nr:hypothetical protein [Enterovirga sp. DB1703]NNM74730.1 hypothetical protein [Enterovirga sp. DB1703]